MENGKKSDGFERERNRYSRGLEREREREDEMKEKTKDCSITRDNDKPLWRYRQADSVQRVPKNFYEIGKPLVSYRLADNVQNSSHSFCPKTVNRLLK